MAEVHRLLVRKGTHHAWWTAPSLHETCRDQGAARHILGFPKLERFRVFVQVIIRGDQTPFGSFATLCRTFLGSEGHRLR